MTRDEALIRLQSIRIRAVEMLGFLERSHRTPNDEEEIRCLARTLHAEHRSIADLDRRIPGKT